MAKTVHLTIPISEEQVRALEIDDIVYLSGVSYSFLYREHHIDLMEKLEAGEEVPVKLRDGVAYHTGAIYVKDETGHYDIRSIGSTTSAKFNDLTPKLIALTGVRAIIGKGGMDREVLRTMQKYGCVYLAASGGSSSFYKRAIRILSDIWPEAGLDTCNQRLQLELKDAGPYFVAMDAHGNSIYEAIEADMRENAQKIYDCLGISADPD